jgi:hypothetical protein
MVLINKATNEVTLKLVYYGPGLCGKTTNLEKIYKNPKLENKGKMISMATETDRTLFFDFMPMELGTIAGQKIRVQLYTVPGQVFYDATRKLVLRGADGVVFVADSQASMRESNLESLENLRANLRLNRLDPEKIAIVYQYNKRDLPGVASVEEMNEYMMPGPIPVAEAIAIQGVGVTATLRQAVARMLENLKGGVDITLSDQPPLAAPDMTARAGVPVSAAPAPKVADAAPVAAAAAPIFGDVTAAIDAGEDVFADVPFARPPASTPLVAAPVRAAPPAEYKDDIRILLGKTQEIIRALETALEAARAHEQELTARLSR